MLKKLSVMRLSSCHTRFTFQAFKPSNTRYSCNSSQRLETPGSWKECLTLLHFQREIFTGCQGNKKSQESLTPRSNNEGCTLSITLSRDHDRTDLLHEMDTSLTSINSSGRALRGKTSHKSYARETKPSRRQSQHPDTHGRPDRSKPKVRNTRAGKNCDASKQ